MDQEMQKELSTSTQVKEEKLIDKEKETCSENESCLNQLENLSLQETDPNETKEDISSETKESKPEEGSNILEIKTNENSNETEPTKEPTSNLRGSVEVAVQVEPEPTSETETKEAKEEEPAKCEKCGDCVKCENCKECIKCVETDEKAGTEYRVLTDEEFFDDPNNDEYYDVEEEEVDEEEDDEEEEEREEREKEEKMKKDEEELQNEDKDDKYSGSRNNNVIKLEMITEAQLAALEKMVISEHETFTMNSRIINDNDTWFSVKFNTSSYSGYQKELMDPDNFMPVDPNTVGSKQCQQLTPSSVTVLSAMMLGFGVYVLVTYFKSSVLYKMFMRKQ